VGSHAGCSLLGVPSSQPLYHHRWKTESHRGSLNPPLRLQRCLLSSVARGPLLTTSPHLVRRRAMHHMPVSRQQRKLACEGLAWHLQKRRRLFYPRWRLLKLPLPSARASCCRCYCRNFATPHSAEARQIPKRGLSLTLLPGRSSPGRGRGRQLAKPVTREPRQALPAPVPLSGDECRGEELSPVRRSAVAHT